MRTIAFDTVVQVSRDHRNSSGRAGENCRGIAAALYPVVLFLKRMCASIRIIPFFIHNSRFCPLSLPESQAPLLRNVKERRTYSGTRSTISRRKRNRYRDKMLGNSQSSPPARFRGPSVLRSTRIHRAKRGCGREQRIRLGKKEAEEVIVHLQTRLAQGFIIDPSHPYLLTAYFRYRLPERSAPFCSPSLEAGRAILPYGTHNYYNVPARSCCH